MCGIAGLYHPDLPAPDLNPALAALAHRGPDDAGLWQGQAASVGACRLAIIDLSGGRQPVANEDGGVVAVQNGEIYNYLELMAELETLGHRFSSRSDTEVLVHAWEQWGVGCVEQFRGMFALAIHDRRRRSLFLARDRFGIKPLYLAGSGRALAFASELPALLTLLPERPTLNPAPLARLLSLGWVPGPATLYRGVEHLPPAHSLLLDEDGASLRRYWQPEPSPRPALRSGEEIIAQLDGLLQETVNLHLRSDVPVGALLSGGIDSGVLVALMRRSGHPNLRTFNIGFDHAGYDETGFAQLAAGHLGVQHHTLRFEAGAGDEAFDLLPDLVGRYGQPVGSATHLAIWLLYRACAAAGLKVILTGEGADELFGGYQWYAGETRLAAARAWPDPFRRLAARAAGLLGISPTAADLLRQPRLPLVDRYRRWLTPHSFAQAAAWLHPDLRAQADLTLPWAPPAADLHPLQAMTLLDLQSRLPDFINLEVDRMSMAHSVEARVPFLDHRLWEAVLSWEPSLNLRNGLEKGLLRQIARPLLPPAIVQRRKQGLASPHAAWWRRQRLPDWAEDLLQPAALASAGLFHPPAVLSLRQAHRSGQMDAATPLTAMLTAQVWAGW
ncbi:MAG: asparagine synthase (glutamine-hydrolyzing) [Caldilineales bacterium]|nr:asparagine synthase (glutamine-hydrolyzing) [Caldilineales bacterium]